MKVVGIETSCDETGIAIYDSEQGLLGHALYSQVNLHKPFGGVVPELASRDHVKYLVPLMDEVFIQAQIKKSELDAVAYTSGPGLIGALLAGASFAKSFAYARQIPALAVHHLEAHLLAAQFESPELNFPFTALLVSGGHTQLIQAHALGHYELLGDTLDDAVGEAFDKTAKSMGLAYPGGAVLAQLADQCSEQEAMVIPPFPKPMVDRPGLDFSFSGLKTHVLTTWNQNPEEGARARIAYRFQEAVVATLLIKCRRALVQTASTRLVVAGGVGANRSLRESLKQLMQQMQGEVYFPSPQYCTDNGVMVAYAGCLHLLEGRKDDSLSINVRARWPLT